MYICDRADSVSLCQGALGTRTLRQLISLIIHLRETANGLNLGRHDQTLTDGAVRESALQHWQTRRRVDQSGQINELGLGRVTGSGHESLIVTTTISPSTFNRH